MVGVAVGSSISNRIKPNTLKNTATHRQAWDKQLGDPWQVTIKYW